MLSLLIGLKRRRKGGVKTFGFLSLHANKFWSILIKKTQKQRKTSKVSKQFMLHNDKISNILDILAAKMHLLGEISTHSFMTASIKKELHFSSSLVYHFCTVQIMIINIKVSYIICQWLLCLPVIFCFHLTLLFVCLYVRLYGTVCLLVSALMTAPVTSVLV